MIDDEEIEEFLEHHGVKGMHWGVRSAQKQTAIKERNQNVQNLSRGSKSKIIGISAAATLGSWALTNKLSGIPIVNIVGGVIGGTLAGRAATNHYLKKHGQTKAAKIPKQKPLKGQAKANALLDQALQKPNSRFILNGTQTVTGKQFVDFLVNGGLLDINTTNVYETPKRR